MTARDDAEVVEAVAGVLCASRDLTDARHEAQDVPCGPCYRDAAALLPFIREREEAALREAVERLDAEATRHHEQIAADWTEAGIICGHGSDPCWHKHDDGCASCGLRRAADHLRAALTDGGGDE